MNKHSSSESEKEEELDPNNNEEAFAILETNYNKTIAEIEKNPEAVTYINEYKRLFAALFNTNKKQKELSEKCSELEKQVADCAEKLHEVTKLREADLETIKQLQFKIQHAWRMADAAHDREQQTQEVADNLRNELSVLIAEKGLKEKIVSGKTNM